MKVHNDSDRDSYSRLNNIYCEFKLLNKFLKKLNTHFQSGSYDNYTVMFDKCISEIYSIQCIHNQNNQCNDNFSLFNINELYNSNEENSNEEKGNEEKGNEENVNEQYFDYLIQNIVLNIKSGLRNNYNIIDQNIEKLKIRNKKLVDKLKLGIENAEYQENYIEEIEKNLEKEKEKNKHINSLMEKINSLTKKNEQLIFNNEQLEHNYAKQQRETQKIKMELKKYTEFYERSKEHENKYIKKSILNEQKSDYSKRKRKSKKKTTEETCHTERCHTETCHTATGGFKSYSNEFFDSVEENEEKHWKNIQKEKYIPAGEPKQMCITTTAIGIRRKYSTPGENNKDINSSVKKEDMETNRNTSKYETENYGNKHEKRSHETESEETKSETTEDDETDIHVEPSDAVPNGTLPSDVIEKEEDTNNCNAQNRKTLPTYKIYSSSSFSKIEGSDSLSDKIKYINRHSSKMAIKEKQEEVNIYQAAKLKSSKVGVSHVLDRNYNFRTNLLTDIRKTLRSSRTDLINSMLKKYVQRVERKKSREMIKIHQNVEFSNEVFYEIYNICECTAMMIEEYCSLLSSLYAELKNDYKLCIENGSITQVELLSDYSQKIIEEIGKENNALKKSKVERITRKFLRQIDSYREIERKRSESSAFSKGETEESTVDNETKNEKYVNLNYSRYNSMNARKFFRNNFHLKNGKSYESEEEVEEEMEDDSFASNFTDKIDSRIIDRLKDFKSNISFYKLYEYIGFSKKEET